VATSLVIKYSVANSAPAAGSLFPGEQAYSFVSNVLFIGHPDGSVQNTGGYFYTQILDSRTAQAIPNTLVLRTAQGNIVANSFVGTVTGSLFGTANAARVLANTITMTLTGDANAFITTNGSGNNTYQLTLNTTGVAAGTYGGTSNIPVFTVDSKGRLTQVSNVAISVASEAFTISSYNTANNAFHKANAAFEAANAATPQFAQGAYNTANAAFIAANTPSHVANSSSSYANGAFAVANTANAGSISAGIYANAAFALANSFGGTTDALARTRANASFEQANGASQYANAAFYQSNLAYSTSQSASTTAAAALDAVNLLGSNQANITFDTTAVNANASGAFHKANAAFAVANTKFNTTGGTITGNMVVAGNLTVSGNITYVNTNELNIGDNIITLNADLPTSTAPTQDSGIEVNRGSSANVAFKWSESSRKWQYTTDGTVYNNIASELAEIYANAAFAKANTAISEAAIAAAAAACEAAAASYPPPAAKS
jgi:hypothetical protein